MSNNHGFNYNNGFQNKQIFDQAKGGNEQMSKKDKPLLANEIPPIPLNDTNKMEDIVTHDSKYKKDKNYLEEYLKEPSLQSNPSYYSNEEEKKFIKVETKGSNLKKESYKVGLILPPNEGDRTP